jgi:hypothetical protein
MSLILGQYAVKLYEIDNGGPKSCEQIMIFANAILSSEAEYYYIRSDGLEFFEHDRQYRDIYLAKLYAGTSLLMEGSAFTLALLDKNHPDYKDLYKELYKEYDVQLAMTNFWMTQNIIANKLRTENNIPASLVGCSISDLKFIDGEANYTFTHFDFHKRSFVNEAVITDFMEKGQKLESEWYLESLQQQQAMKDALFWTIVKDVASSIAIGGTTLALAKFC